MNALRSGHNDGAQDGAYYQVVERLFSSRSQKNVHTIKGCTPRDDDTERQLPNKRDIRSEQKPQDSPQQCTQQSESYHSTGLQFGSHQQRGDPRCRRDPAVDRPLNLPRHEAARQHV